MTLYRQKNLIKHQEYQSIREAKNHSSIGLRSQPYPNMDLNTESGKGFRTVSLSSGSRLPLNNSISPKADQILE